MIDTPTVELLPEELRVLLFVPTKRDASVATRLLTEGNLTSESCASMAELVQEIERGAAAIMTTAELIGDGNANRLITLLEKQEKWSDLPMVVLMRGGTGSPDSFPALNRLTNVTILERPAPLRSVLSAIQTAVRGRRRQYEMRTQLVAIREAEAKAQRSERAKDDFLAALSHELRTPLNPVLLLASESAGDPSLTPQVRANFELIAKNANLEARLIDDLLDLTRITRGKVKLEMSSVDILPVVSDAIVTVETDFLHKAITLSTEFADEHAVVEGDPVRLQQVFWNVLKNSAKFTPHGGRVSVRTFRQNSPPGVVVEVRDSGIGMMPDEIDRVFDAFAQGNHSSRDASHRFGGLGLGLAISRSLVQLHQGEIKASSPGRDLGSTFTIVLPLAKTLVTRPAVSPLANVRRNPAPSHRFRILLVEDHAATRSVLMYLLKQRHHEVRSASSVSEARQVAGTFDFDVLMTDLGLPDGSGYELMAEFRHRPGVTGIALTGYGMDEDIDRSERAGFFTHLVKPLQVHILDAALKSVAASHDESVRSFPSGEHP